MKGEKDTASNTDSSRPSSPIPTLFLSPLTIPPDSAGEGVGDLSLFRFQKEPMDKPEAYAGSWWLY